MVSFEAIKISNGFFVFNNPDQEYDPTPHPSLCRSEEHVRSHFETGNPELDFINELYATALRSGISPYSLQIEKWSVCHPAWRSQPLHQGTLSRTSRLLSPPKSSNHPIAIQKRGDLDKKVVENRVNQLLAESRSLYASDPLQQNGLRRIGKCQEFPK